MSVPIKSQRTLVASHWGTYEVEVERGVLKGVHGLADDPAPSIIGQGWLGTHDDACRIPAPMVRQSYLEHGPSANTRGRGREPFVRIDWRQAEALIVEEVHRVREQYGNQAIFAGSYGWASAGRFHHAQSHLHRFLNALGGFSRSVNTYSLAAGEVILPYVIGPVYPLVARHTPWASIAEHGELVVAFGGLPIKNAQVNMGGSTQHIQYQEMCRARARGVEFVNVSPQCSDTLDELDADWLPIRPNTDVALMLALCHCLLEQNLHDGSFLDRYCIGFAEFEAYLRGLEDGVEKTATWAAEITEIDEASIRRLAQRMASQRTLVSLSWSLTRQDHGEQPFWAGVSLAAMLGGIGLPGTGVGLGYSAINNVGNHSARLPWASLDRGKNPVKSFIPVARIADMLLDPGGEFDFNGRRHQYPDVHLLYWVGGNPFHHHQDLNRLRQAFEKPDSIIVHESWWNATARHADIVLPATTPLERNDLVAASREGFAVACHQAVEPFAQSRNDFDIFAGLAERLGVADIFTEGMDEMGWIRHLYELARQRAGGDGFELPSFDEFWQSGRYEAAPPAEPKVLFSEFRENPNANPLTTPTGKIEIFSATVAGFGLDDCPGHAAWMTPVEWLGSAAAKRFPLHLLSNQPKTRLHSQLDNGGPSRAAKVNGREVVTLNPADAAARNISDGQVVRIWNDRGACLAVAQLSTSIRPNVVELATGAWFNPTSTSALGDFCNHGNPNVLTRDQGTSTLAQGPSANSCLVEIEPIQDEPPPVTAFEPPPICSLKP